MRPYPDPVLLDRAHAPSPVSLQHYPIRARRPDYDPLVDGMAAVDSDLGPTLLPILQQPMPRDPENIGAPNCRSVKGIDGVMIQVAELRNIEITTIPSEFEMQSPINHPPRQVIQSPTFIQSPVGIYGPEGEREPFMPNPTSTLPTASPSTSGQKSDDKFKTEFRFVVNEDAKTARNTVRQHVMREYRRRERWEQGRNKVSKSKKPSRKESKAVVKTEPDSQTTSGARLPQSQDVSTTASSQSDRTTQNTSLQQNANDAGQLHRRNSGSMSISGSSDSSGSDADRFSALLTQGEDAAVKRSQDRLPFARYADNGIHLHPEDVEEAVEEIERQELHQMQLPYQQDPWAEIARASINPFSTHLDVGASTASRSLLHHYAWVMPSLMDEIVTGTVFHRIGWLYSSVANHDPTPFHTIVGFTLGHIAMLRGMDEPRRAIEHKDKSLQLINCRLADPRQAASDASIGAIANIAAYELIDCNPERFAMHMRGLARLVMQRGGMSDTTFKPDLETVLIRLDTIRAYMAISQPRFPTWAVLRSLPPLAINIGPIGVDAFPPQSGYSMHQYLFCEDAIRLIHGLEDVLMLMRSLSPSIPFSPDPAFKLLLVDSLIHHLRRNLFEAPPEFSNHISRRVIRMAAIVLIDMAAAEFFQPRALPLSPLSQSSDTNPKPQSPPSASFPRGNLNSDQPERTPGSAQKPVDKKGLGLTRLRERFPSIEENRHTWGRSVEMIVAVLMQAERMALERPFRAWYVADIVTLTMKLGDDGWRAVESALMNDIKTRISSERMARQNRLNVQPTGMGTGMEDLPTWEMDQAVRRFWHEWK